MSETATLSSPATAPSTAAPAVESSPASAPAEATRSEPTAQGTDRRTQDNPTAPKTPAANPREQRLEKLRQMEATAKGNGNPANPAEPAPAPKATPAPTAPAAKDSSSEGMTFTRKMLNEQGVEADVQVTLDEATEAIIRDGYSADFIRNLTNKKILEIGSRRMREQRRQDAFGAQAAQWRRVAEGAGKPPAQAASPANPAAAQAAQTQTPAAIASPTAPVDQQPAGGTSKFSAQIEALRQAGGDEIATAMNDIVSAMQAGTVPADQQKQWAEQLQALETKHQQQLTQAYAIQVDREFSSARREHKADWPQLKDEAVFERVKKRADTFARSGEWENPLASFDEIFVQACNSVFANQQAETNALKLEESRRKQREGQPARVVDRQSNSAPQAMTRAQRLREMENRARTDGPDAARAWARSAAATTG